VNILILKLEVFFYLISHLKCFGPQPGAWFEGSPTTGPTVVAHQLNILVGQGEPQPVVCRSLKAGCNANSKSKTTMDDINLQPIFIADLTVNVNSATVLGSTVFRVSSNTSRLLGASDEAVLKK
jgi:hypothetical protein